MKSIQKNACYAKNWTNPQNFQQLTLCIIKYCSLPCLKVNSSLFSLLFPFTNFVISAYTVLTIPFLPLQHPNNSNSVPLSSMKTAYSCQLIFWSFISITLNSSNLEFHLRFFIPSYFEVIFFSIFLQLRSKEWRLDIHAKNRFCISLHYIQNQLWNQEQVFFLHSS